MSDDIPICEDECVTWGGHADNCRVVATITALRAEVERLNLAIKKQAASALMGMDAAKAIAASNVREAARLYAESNPSAIDSERTANQLLTDEIDKLRSQLSARDAEVRALRDVIRAILNSVPFSHMHAPLARRARALLTGEPGPGGEHG
jgi:hypothetical protein